MLTRTLPFAVCALAPALAAALPPNAPTHLRGGANHHTGDDAFIAKYGREPRPGDEKLRMREHFLAVRARLAAAKPTRPELAAQRAKLIGFLDRYIEQGITPANEQLPWRTPVFIDQHGTICAVGYLIEQSAGRALAEKIAATHRYSLLEEIAADIPEVRQWVEASGFSLEELGSIQPGYPGPEVLTWTSWTLASRDEMPPDGPYVAEEDTREGALKRGKMEGTLKRGKMEGDWVRRIDDVVVGRGTFHHGNGAWIGYFEDGKTKQAEGAFRGNYPEGTWRMYHPSGHLAAEGKFARGQRVGGWRFYYDHTQPTLIASGSFTRRGAVTGRWRHFDQHGKLLASSLVATPKQWRKRRKEQLFWSVGYLVDIVPGEDGIIHQIHQGSIDGEGTRFDKLETADRKLRVYSIGERLFDSDGRELAETKRGWVAKKCAWNAAAKRAARAGDVAALHGLLFVPFGGELPSCADDGVAIGSAKAARARTLAHAMETVRAASPRFIQKLVEGEVPEDLPNVLAKNMALDIEWPHVDKQFITTYRGLPGYRSFY